MHLFLDFSVVHIFIYFFESDPIGLNFFTEIIELLLSVINLSCLLFILNLLIFKNEF
jgi:hypothetical protein